MALYLYGTVADTSMDGPLPKEWSVTDHVTFTPQPLTVAEWSGKAFYTERNENYAFARRSGLVRTSSTAECLLLAFAFP
jgi:hypothetical protein